MLPVIGIHWVAPEEHQEGVSTLLTAGSRDLTLVDCVSFHRMRRLGVPQAFAFDQEFAEHGFQMLPSAVVK